MKHIERYYVFFSLVFYKSIRKEKNIYLNAHNNAIFYSVQRR